MANDVNNNNNNNNALITRDLLSLAQKYLNVIAHKAEKDQKQASYINKSGCKKVVDTTVLVILVVKPYVNLFKYHTF